MNYKEIFESFTQKVISDKKRISKENMRDEISLISLGYKDNMTSEEAFEFSIKYCRSRGLNPIRKINSSLFNVLHKDDNNIVIRYNNAMCLYEIIKRVPLNIACEIITSIGSFDREDELMGIICINIEEFKNTFEIESKDEFLKLFNVDENIINDEMDLKYLPQILDILIDPMKYKK